MNISYTPDTHRYTQIGTDGYIWSSVSDPTCQIYKIIIIMLIIIIIIIVIIIIIIIIKVSMYKNYEIIRYLYKCLLYTIYNILVLVLYSIRYIQS